MFNEIFTIIDSNPIRAVIIIASMVIIFSLLLWVSIIDIKKKSITFWKMLLASASCIIMPFIASFFCGCGLLKYFLLGSLGIWFLFLFLNIKYNNDRFVGKADVDLLSALVAECIGLSAWMLNVLEPNIAWIRITHIWYTLFLYLLLGALVFIVIYLSSFLIKVFLIKNESFKKLIKETKVSVIPMLMPAALMIPYTIMTV